MAANYLHGVETIELPVGPVPVRVVKSAVIALVGIAPTGPKQTLTLVQSQTDASQFGKNLPGFNIPHALDAIQKQGFGTVLVVNVFDPESHVTPVSETKLVAGGKIKLTHAPIIDADAELGLEINDGATPTPNVYEEGTDYNFDEFGRLTIIPGGGIANGDTVTCVYNRLDGTAVSNADLIGDVVNDVRTGHQLFAEAYQSFGFTPRIFICPGYSSVKAIADEMIIQAEKFDGHAIIDSTVGATPTEAISDRGDATTAFGTSSKRAILTYPRLKAYSEATLDDAVVPYSPYLAGVIAATDNTDGYWFSPSNRQIKGITGVERTITAAVNDPSTDANLLNEAGIVTVFNSFGTGLRVWGNRAASFPTSTAPTNFIPVQRTADILHESNELAMLQFIDRPINGALIDTIRETTNTFIRTLVQRGALVDGECTFNPAKNPPAQIAAGQLIFDIVFMPPTPAERITFESYIDVNLLSTLTSSN